MQYGVIRQDVNCAIQKLSLSVDMPPAKTLLSIGFWFLPRDAMQARPMSSCGVCLSVCLSVCVSVTFVNSVKTNKKIIKFFFTVG